MAGVSDRRLVGGNPIDPSEYFLYSNNIIELYSITDTSSTDGSYSNLDGIGRKSYKINQKAATLLTCASWNPSILSNSMIGASGPTNKSIITYGNINGSVFVHDWNSNQELLVNPGKASGRTCNGLSWSSHSPNLLAGGFDLLRNEYSAVIWDIERLSSSATSQSHILHNFGLGEAISSITWSSREENVVIMGTSRGFVRFYDIRSKKSSDLSVRISDPDKVCKVKGIRVDPYSSCVAVFSDTVGDSVKILDIRVGDTNSLNKSKNFITLNVLPVLQEFDKPMSYNIVDVAWSPVRANTLAVATSPQLSIPIFNVLKNPSESITKSPLYSLSVPETIKSLSWCHPRMLVAVVGGVLDINVRERQALSYTPIASLKDDLHTHGFFNDIYIKKYVQLDDLLCTYRPLSVSTDALIQYNETQSISNIDISDERKNIAVIIRQRTLAGYGVNAAKNLQVCSDELDYIYGVSATGERHCQPLSERQLRRRFSLELFKVWEWIERMGQDTDSLQNLSDKGVLPLFQNVSLVSNDTPYRHDKLGTFVYVSEVRSAALELCGWINIIGVKSLKMTRDAKKREEFERKDSQNQDKLINFVLSVSEECFERAVALAVWHGDIALAVSVLRKYVSSWRSRHNQTKGFQEKLPPRVLGSISSSNNDERSDDLDTDSSDWDEEVTDTYLNVVSLVAACFAGYHHVSSQKNELWISMCEEIIRQLQHFPRIAMKYLLGSCKFLLLSQDANPDYTWILSNEDLFLEDRVAFACNFVTFDRVYSWLKDILHDRTSKGLLDGLVLTGLSSEGLSILQAYLDNTSDVQSCALITSFLATSDQRIIYKNEKALKFLMPRRETQWLYEYRSLLNKWEMFFERARLDVEIGKIQRRHENIMSISGTSNAPDADLSKVKNVSTTDQTLSSRQLGKSVDKNKSSTGDRRYFSTPMHQPHTLIKCHFCGEVLPLDVTKQQNQTTANTNFSRKLAPVINCCLSCKKQLPRCYVCQLYLGMVNPNYEFTRLMARKRHISESQLPNAVRSVSINMLENSEHHALDFGQWFFFCQRCKHGGHATCVDNWFTSSSSLLMDPTSKPNETKEGSKKLVQSLVLVE